MRFHLRVAGEIVPSVELTDVAASYSTSWNPLAPGTLDVEWTVLNSGNVRLAAEQVLGVLAPLGLDAGVEDQVVAEQREVLPGQTASFATSVEAWPLGRLTAQLSSRQEVVGEDVVAEALPTAVVEVGVAAVPWPHLLVFGLLMLGAAIAVVRRRRSRKPLARAVEAARVEGTREAVPPVAAPAAPPATTSSERLEAPLPKSSLNTDRGVTTR